jgi:hypothetical protein
MSQQIKQEPTDDWNDENLSFGGSDLDTSNGTIEDVNAKQNEANVKIAQLEVNLMHFYGILMKGGAKGGIAEWPAFILDHFQTTNKHLEDKLVQERKYAELEMRNIEVNLRRKLLLKSNIFLFILVDTKTGKSGFA